MSNYNDLIPEIRDRYEKSHAEVTAIKAPSMALYECGTPAQTTVLLHAYMDFQKAAKNCLGTEAAKILEALRQVSGEEQA